MNYNARLALALLTSVALGCGSPTDPIAHTVYVAGSVSRDGDEAAGVRVDITIHENGCDGNVYTSPLSLQTDEAGSFTARWEVPSRVSLLAVCAIASVDVGEAAGADTVPNLTLRSGGTPPDTARFEIEIGT